MQKLPKKWQNRILQVRLAEVKCDSQAAGLKCDIEEDIDIEGTYNIEEDILKCAAGGSGAKRRS